MLDYHLFKVHWKKLSYSSAAPRLNTLMTMNTLGISLRVVMALLAVAMEREMRLTYHGYTMADGERCGLKTPHG